MEISIENCMLCKAAGRGDARLNSEFEDRRSKEGVGRILPFQTHDPNLDWPNSSFILAPVQSNTGKKRSQHHDQEISNGTTRDAKRRLPC
jgi:hypothetical protein